MLKYFTLLPAICVICFSPWLVAVNSAVSLTHYRKNMVTTHRRCCEFMFTALNLCEIQTFHHPVSQASSRNLQTNSIPGSF